MITGDLAVATHIKDDKIYIFKAFCFLAFVDLRLRLRTYLFGKFSEVGNLCCGT